MIRRIRLTSGLILLSYVLAHFAGHTMGLVSLEAMEAARGWVQWPVYQPVGAAILYAALLSHVALAFEAMYRRRRLRFMTRREIWQLGLGLAIPLALVPHILTTRGVFLVTGGDASYAHVLAMLWIDDPGQGLRQILLLTVAWGHAMIGLHGWLRLKPVWPTLRPFALTASVVIPLLALLGMWQGAKAVLARAEADPAWREAVAAAARALDAGAMDRIAQLEIATLAVLGLLLGLTLIARGARALSERRQGRVVLQFDGGGRVSMPTGASILDAAREHRLAHAAICGGRGRCSTCRVRVLEGLDALPPRSSEEARVLRRVGAEPDIRLACQTRPPAGQYRVRALIDPATAGPADGHGRGTFHVAQGRDMEIVVLFADLRGFTTLSEQRLPYDVVFVLNRYFDCMAAAVRDGGGYLDKFIGDGVMALFGLENGPAAGARGAVLAARRMAERLEELNKALAHDLEQPLRIGVGIHLGPAIVGQMGVGQQRHLTAIGDTVNTASRLESMTKEAGVQLILSDAVAVAAGLALDGLEAREMAVRGRREPIRLRLVPDAASLPL